MLLLFVASVRSCLSKKAGIMKMHGFVVVFCDALKNWHFLLKFQFLSNTTVPFFKKWYQWTNRSLFNVPAYFASLFSFYPTFYGL